MKFIAILLVCAAVCYAEPEFCFGERLDEIRLECLYEEKGSENDLEDLLDLQEAHTDEGKCFRYCLLKKCKLIDEYDNITPTAAERNGLLIAHGHPEKSKIVEDVTAKCMENWKVDESSKCQMAEELFACVFSNCKHCEIDFRNI